MNLLKKDIPTIFFLGALSGLVLFTTVEPLNQWFLFIPGFWPIFYLTDRFRNSWKKILLASGVLSLFLIGAIFHWVIHTMTVFGGLSTVVATLLFLPFTLFFSLKIPAAMLLFGISRRPRWKRAFGPTWFSAGLIATMTELWMPQIFPWYWGNGLGGNLWFLQPVDAVGISGLTFLGVATSRYTYDLLRPALSGNPRGGRIARAVRLRSRFSLYALPALVLIWLVYGGVQLYRMDALQKTLPTLRVAMLQPNTPIDRSDSVVITPTFMENLIKRTIPDLALEAYRKAKGKLDLVVIPEASVPYFTTQDNRFTRRLDIYRPAYRLMTQAIAYNTGADVISNEITISPARGPDRAGRIPLRVHNAATLHRVDGTRGPEYRKRVLLAFGEYIPGLDLIRSIGLIDLVPEPMRYSRFYPGDRSFGLPYIRPTEEERKRDTGRSREGELNPEGRPFVDMEELTETMPEPFQKTFPRDRRMDPDGVFIPLICYEVLFPSYIAGFFQKEENPTFMVNLTQDGWYGDGFETYLHFEMGRIRSVEFRRALVRATNSGSSGFVDILGRHAKPLVGPVFTAQSVQDTQVWDVPLNREDPTIFARMGNTYLYLLTGLWLVRMFLYRKPRRKSRVRS